MYHYLRNLSKQLLAVPAVLLTLCALAGWGFTASASPAPDASTATGVVIDQLGEPMPGASVLVVGTTNGTSTDLEGRFSINHVQVGATLRISFVGCKPAEVKWEGTPLEVQLMDDIETLDEVVVVGFGTQKKVNLTGAVSSVSGKDITSRPVNTVADALQGMAAGLDVLGSARGGQLGGSRSMNIRGTGTIGSGSSVNPLVLIDGMEGDINQLNPADVENISVLKDAAASSIYGSRAAGGVILITTRSGKEGKITVNYSDNFRWSHVTRMPKMANSWQWANYMEEAAEATGRVWMTQDYIDKLKKPTGEMFVNPQDGEWAVWAESPSIMPIANTDWLDLHFGKTGFSQEHNVSVSGGTEKYDFYFSGNLLDQDGILRYGDDGLQRYTINAKINAKLTDWLKFGYSARWYRGKYDAPSFVSQYSSAELYHNIMRYWPNFPAYDPNGNPVKESFIYAMENGGRYQSWEDKFDQQFSFRATPMKGMTLNAEFNYRTQHSNTKQDIQQSYSYHPDGTPYPSNPNGYPYAAGGVGSYLSQSSYRSNYFNPNIYGDYSFSLNDTHNFKVMAGFQSEWYNYEDFSAARNDMINGLPYLSMASGETIRVGGGKATWSTAGWFGRINYDYMGRYMIEGNFRYDGSSRFRHGHRWVSSPSFSLGWNIARENFWQDLITYCNTLKLRFSWGKLANQNTDSWYPTYQTMGYSANSSSWLVNGEKASVGTMPGLISRTLTWEKNKTWDLGLDWGLFNNRLIGTFDYYNRKTEDMVGPGPSVPTVLGANAPKTNNLSMTSKGWELSITWRDRIQDFSYGITANLYDHTITIDEYPNENYTLSSHNPLYNGAKYGDYWGLTTVGIAKSQAEMDAHLDRLDENYKNKNGQYPATRRAGQNRYGTSWGAGDIMYADINGDGVINSGQGTLDDHGDLSVIGNSTPRYSFGLNLDAQWKGFDVKVFFQGVLKRDYNANGSVFWGACGMSQWQALMLEPHLDYFRPEDTESPFGPNLDAYYPRPNWDGGKNNQLQTRYLQNAAYCSLKNVTIGYTLPQSLTRKAYIENLRVFVSGENLAQITDFTKTGDPELIDAYDNAYGYGKCYPLQRVFSVGLNVTF